MKQAKPSQQPLITRYAAFRKAHELLPVKEMDYQFVKMVMEEFCVSDTKIASFIQKHGAGGGIPKYGKKLVRAVHKEPAYQEKRKQHLCSLYPRNPENVMGL